MLVFAFVILSLGFISSTTCDVRAVASCPAVNTVMKLSATTNAHGELNSYNNYPYALCCFGMTYYSAADNASIHNCDSTRNNYVLKLSSPTNAHAEILGSLNYNTNVCFGYFTCTSSLTGSCPALFPLQVASLSAPTNAHLAQYSGYNNVKICCFDNSPAFCGDSLIEAGEDCDCGMDGSCTSAELGGATCASVLGSGWIGTLSCTAPPTGCSYITSGCHKCGNGILEIGEQCDDSNTLNGDCCSSTCQYESSGSSCTSDGNACTNDICNAAGTCTHPAITCNDGSLCTTDTCNTATGCVYTPITCNDGNVCTGDSCNALIGCVYSPLTGPACASDGNACTLDLCSAGSCTHVAISGCCTLNSQCNDNNVCTAPDTCNLVTNTCSNPALSCGVNNDGCCPSGCTIGSDNDCTICGNNGDCNDNNACTTNICSGGACTYPPILSCTSGDGCCPSGCNAVTDNDCTAVCGNGVRENPPELCDGSALNGATCASLLGAGYTGTLTCYAAGTPDECEYNTAACIPPCVITSAFWNRSTPVGSSIVEGTPVLLNITGTNCGGKVVSFDIREKDVVAYDDVTPDPANILFPSSGTSAAGTWISVFQDDGIIEGNPPEYYFVATIGTVTYTSPNSGVNDPGLLRVSELVTCGNGVIDGTETCDYGAANNGIVCTPAYGSSCDYCSGSCAIVTVDGAFCGDGTCDGAPNEDCSSCPADCGACPSTCTLLSAAWNVETISEGNIAELIVGASNCDGEEITFEIYEDDTAGDDLITPLELTNINSYSSSNDNGLWRAEYIDDTGAFDDGGNPEFYFRARVTSTGEELDSNVMTVLNSGACVGITSCADYPQELCNRDDSCGVEEVGQTGCGITPGYPVPECDFIKDCYCEWNEVLGVCENAADTTNPCNFGSECGNGRLDAGEECDGGLLRLNDNSCTLFDAYTDGTVGCYAAGTPYECTYDFRNCLPQFVCGNGVREDGEECDPPLAGECDNLCQDIIPGSDCGNGVVEPGETCDLGQMQLNLIGVDCSNFDAYTSGLVDCYAAGTAYECTYDFSNCADQGCGNDVVEEGEKCEPPSVNGCDANCLWESGGTTEYIIGTCKYTSTSSSSCGEGVTSITVTSVGTMEWDSSNEYTLAETLTTGFPPENFIEEPIGSGIYRYYILAEYNECLDTKQQTIQCPALVELPFFGVYQVVLVIAIVGLIYLVYVLRKNSSKNSKSKKPVKKHKKK